MVVRSTEAEPRVAVVTGASGGIGRAIVSRLVARGMCVVAVDRDDRTASDPCVGSTVLRATVDIADASAVTELGRRVERELGPVYALVNNAGVFERTPALAFDGSRARRILATNLEAALTCTSVFGAAMARRREGRIVNVASIAAASGAALASVYAASKAGLVAATQSHARELAPHGIAVNAVLPGYCHTPMLERDRELIARFVVPRVPLRRVAEPDEVAEVVELLVTVRTPYLTGAAIPIDGGLHVG